MSDYSKMKFNVTDVPAKKLVIDHFQSLAEYEEFSAPENDMLMRIAFLATDEKSPFLLLEREDYEKRLTKIFEFLKIKDIKMLVELTTGTNQEYEAIVNRFMMLIDNLAYVMWSNKLRMFHYIGQVLRQPIGTKDIIAEMGKRATLDKQSKEIYNDLIEYEAQVFSDVPSRNKIRKQIAKLIQPAERYADVKSVV